MTAIIWPPEFDAIKIDEQTILCRVKNTDIWIELDLNHLTRAESMLSAEMKDLVVAWSEVLLLDR